MSNMKVCQTVITAEEKEQSRGKVVKLLNGVTRKPPLRWRLSCKGLKKVQETSVQVSGADSPGRGKADEELLRCVPNTSEEE